MTPVPPPKEEKPPVAPLKEEKPPVNDAQPAEKWMSLFNGKDLTGWKIHPKPHISITQVVPMKIDGKVYSYEGKLKDFTLVRLWTVEDGILIGSARRAICSASAATTRISTSASRP